MSTPTTSLSDGEAVVKKKEKKSSSRFGFVPPKQKDKNKDKITERRLLPSSAPPGLREVVDTQAERDERREAYNRRRAISEDIAAEEAKKYSFGRKKVAPLGPYVEDLGKTLDEMANVRWASVSSPASPEFQALLETEAPDADAAGMAGVAAHGALAVAEEEKSVASRGSIWSRGSRGSVDAKKNKKDEPHWWEIKRKVVEEQHDVPDYDHDTPRRAIIEEVVSMQHPVLGMLACACHSDGSLTIHHQPPPFIEGRVGMVDGGGGGEGGGEDAERPAMPHLRAHGFGGVLAAFTSDGQALCTAGRRDGAVLVWRIVAEDV
jgi:hypothetical protein